ncbi:MAG: hypothetical protein ACYS80_02165 [Planctomycetota bacterium]
MAFEIFVPAEPNARFTAQHGYTSETDISEPPYLDGTNEKGAYIESVVIGPGLMQSVITVPAK